MVSVVMCTYNYGHFIREAVTSVLQQTCEDLECIVIDNGSTDDTAQVIGSLHDPRIRYVQQAHTGVSAGRNRGLMMSRGEYVCFLDADDRLEKEKLAKSVQVLEKYPATDLVYSDMRYFRDNDPGKLFYTYGCVAGDRPWMKYISGSGREVVAELLNGNIMVICSPVFRKSLLQTCGYFDESLQMNEDWDLWLRIALKGAKILYHDDTNTRALVRVHSSSLSRDIFRMQVSGLRVLLKNEEAIRSFGLDKELEQRQGSHYSAIVATLAGSTRGQLKERYSYLVEVALVDRVMKSPFSFKKMKLLWRLRSIT